MPIAKMEALEKMVDVQKKKYKAEVPIKALVLIQNDKDFGTVWNITVITMQFNTLNIKIDADTGKVVDENMTNILHYKTR